MMIGPRTTAQDITALRALHGLDHGIGTQVGCYQRDPATGDIGALLSRKRPVAS